MVPARCGSIDEVERSRVQGAARNHPILVRRSDRPTRGLERVVRRQAPVEGVLAGRHPDREDVVRAGPERRRDHGRVSEVRAGLVPAGAATGEIATQAAERIADVLPDILQRSRERSRARDHRQNERTEHGYGGKSHTALEIGRPEVPAPPNPMAQPVGALVGSVRQKQQREPCRAEQHDGRVLVVQGQRHAGDQHHGQEQDAVHGPVVAEHVVRSSLGRAPDQDSQNEAVVTKLQRRQLMAPREVQVGLGNRVGGRLEPTRQTRRGVG